MSNSIQTGCCPCPCYRISLDTFTGSRVKCLTPLAAGIAEIIIIIFYWLRNVPGRYIWCGMLCKLTSSTIGIIIYHTLLLFSCKTAEQIRIKETAFHNKICLIFLGTSGKWTLRCGCLYFAEKEGSYCNFITTHNQKQILLLHDPSWYLPLV